MPLRALLLALALLVAGCTGDAPPKPPPLTADQLLAYERAVIPHLKDGGRTVEQGMKPGVDDLLNRHVVPPATIAAEADRWAADLTRVRDTVNGIDPPRALAEAGRLFVTALDTYIRAARTFGEAARAPEARRREIANRGYDLGRDADRTYDAASRILQTERRRLGLGPSPDFPDPTPTP